MKLESFWCFNTHGLMRLKVVGSLKNIPAAVCLHTDGEQTLDSLLDAAAHNR